MKLVDILNVSHDYQPLFLSSLGMLALYFFLDFFARVYLQKDYSKLHMLSMYSKLMMFSMFMLYFTDSRLPDDDEKLLFFGVGFLCMIAVIYFKTKYPFIGMSENEKAQRDYRLKMGARAKKSQQKIKIEKENT